MQSFLTPGVTRLSHAAAPLPLLLAAAAEPTSGSSDALDSAITAAAALGAALIAGGLTWVVGKESRNATARAAADAQLREARQHAAEDVRTVGDVGANLEKAVAKLLETDGAAESRSAVEAGCVDLEARLEFIWDEELRKRMNAFAHHARESTAAYATEEVRTHGAAAVEAWTSALERAGVVWRALMRAAIEAGELLTTEAMKADAQLAAGDSASTGDVPGIELPGRQ